MKINKFFINYLFLCNILIFFLLFCIKETKASDMGNDLLNKEKSIVSIAAFTAQGEIEHLKVALQAGLDNGLSVSEIKEILVQMYAYTGFPRSLNGLAAFSNVLQERKKQGIKENQGREPSPLQTNKTSLERGTENQKTLTGRVVSGGIMDFSPAIDVFLKAHLFGDIFGRDNLDWKSREIATVSALASLDGLESQLTSHCSVAMHIGVTEKQLYSIVDVLAEKVGQKESERLKNILLSK